MPAEKNMTLRVVVPIIVTLAAIGIGIAFFINATTGGNSASKPPANSAPKQADPAPQSAADDQPARQQPADDDASDSPTQSTPTIEPPATDEPTETITTTDAPATGLRARRVPALDDPIVLGSLDENSGYRLEVELTQVGAGIERAVSSHYYKTIKHKEHYLIQQRLDSGDGTVSAIPLSMTGMMVDGQWVPLFNAGDQRYWRLKSSNASEAVFEAMIENDAGQEVLRLQRWYTLDQGTFDIRVRQHVANLTDRAIDFSFVQTGPVQLPEDMGGYRIALDRVRFGALLDPKRDPSQTFVEGDRKLISGQKALEWSTKPDAMLWPNEKTYDGYSDLVWAAQTSRYFSAIVHSAPEQGQSKALWAAAKVYPQSLAYYDAKRGTVPGALHLELQSYAYTAQPGQSVSLTMGFYTGPRSEKYLGADENPVYGRTAMDSIVVYQLSFGLCAICTFQWLAHLLHAFLSLLHEYVVFDWALAIMVLVVIVRTILHPITKKSQISMMRFSKQMQALAPKQKAIQEKYKNDKVKMQQEMTRLMREEGVNYAGMLGCLPMFLQTPIWIALYAMLYTVFDLRHEPAFFGVVQSVFPNWSFLGDLSVGDHFIDFGRSLFSIPMMGDITGINILPFLLGVVFFIQQKYMSPPPSAQLTPEQQSQQKMMKIMMIVLFPLFMYNAPSALAIYFITNSTLGILESRYIRSHIDQDTLVPEKPKHAGLGRKKVKNKAKSPFKRDEEPRKHYKDRG